MAFKEMEETLALLEKLRREASEVYTVRSLADIVRDLIDLHISLLHEDMAIERGG